MPSEAKFQILDCEDRHLLFPQLFDIGRTNREVRKPFIMDVHIPTMPDGRGIKTRLGVLVDGLTCADAGLGILWILTGGVRRGDIALQNIHLHTLVGEAKEYEFSAHLDVIAKTGDGRLMGP